MVEESQVEWALLNNGLAYCTHKFVAGNTRPSHFDGLIINDAIMRRESFQSALLHHLSADETQLYLFD